LSSVRGLIGQAIWFDDRLCRETVIGALVSACGNSRDSYSNTTVGDEVCALVALLDGLPRQPDEAIRPAAFVQVLHGDDAACRRSGRQDDLTEPRLLGDGILHALANADLCATVAVSGPVSGKSIA